MEQSLYKSGRLCVRNMMALMGAAVVAVSALPQGAAAQVQEWHDLNFQKGVFGPDNAVDVVYWSDPTSNDEWVYVTGYHTVRDGVTVFATSKYLATYTGPEVENDPFIDPVYYPSRESAIGTNRAVAIDIDPVTGDVYVTGESADQTGANGQDIVVIKYTKDLVPHDEWILAGQSDAVVRWNNDTFDGDDRPVDIALAEESQLVGVNNVVGITGTSYAGVANGLDIKTIMLDTVTGNYFGDWGSGSQLNPRTRQGSAGGDDRPVGIEAYWTVDPGAQATTHRLHAIVAGTLSQVHGAQINDDIWTTEYNINGNTTWEEVYNGPANGDDVATGLDGLFR